MASTQTEPPPPLPSGKNRTRSRIFIAAFVGIQFLVPLTYLLRDDATDDRFTWRSLATPEASECEATASIVRGSGEQEPIELETTLHEDWVDYVRLGRQSVVNAFLERTCAENGVTQVELVTRCADRETAFHRECASAEGPARTAAR